MSYPDVYRAGEVCATRQRLQNEFLIEMEDAAYVTREQHGKIKLHQTQPRIAQYGGTVMHSSLSPEAEAKLQSALTEGLDPKMAA